MGASGSDPRNSVALTGRRAVLRCRPVGATTRQDNGGNMRGSTTRRLGWVGLIGVAAVTVACSSTSAEDDAIARDRADQLVDAAAAAGVAPRLTPEVAESLYGTDASAVCDAFSGGTSTAGELILLGNLAQGRRQTITDDAVVYARLVIETYCPDVAGDFRRSVRDIDAVEKSN